MAKPTDAGSRMIVIDGYVLNCLRPSTKTMIAIADLDSGDDEVEKLKKLDALWPKVYGFCTDVVTKTGTTGKKIALDDVPMEVLLNGLSKHPSFRE